MEDHVLWYIGQDETGTMDTEHIQLTFGFKNPRALTGVQKVLNNPNIQTAEDPEKCIKYCTDKTKREGELYSYVDINNFSKNVNTNIIGDTLLKDNYEEAMKYIED